ncbi:MAG: hypothetical protein H7288_25735 [Kineosporiaceae bacterium]|nr:hypothetical protein [Aeromicrobium sp.]
MAWHASKPAGIFEWTGHLGGSQAATARVRECLLLPGNLALTPTGPYPARDEADEIAVLSVVFELYGGNVELTADIPDLTFDAPDDAVF